MRYAPLVMNHVTVYSKSLYAYILRLVALLKCMANGGMGVGGSSKGTEVWTEQQVKQKELIIEDNYESSTKLAVILKQGFKKHV